MIESEIFWGLVVFRRHIMRIGRTRIMISVAMLGTALPMKNVLLLMQSGWTVLSQKPYMGLQEKIDTSTTAIHHAATRPATAEEINLKSGVAKTRR